jgi:hypothetical protein
MTSEQFFTAYYLHSFETRRFIHMNCAEWYIVGDLWRTYFLSAGDSTEDGQWFVLSDKGKQFVEHYYKTAIKPELEESETT